MHLRSGAYYRSGNLSVAGGFGSISTQESTARTQTHVSETIETVAYETDTESSMASFSTNPFETDDHGLTFEGKLTYLRDNEHGAKIYKDYYGKFAVKVEDHPSEFNPGPYVNFQGDRHMGRNGVMYLMVEDPDEVDTLGQKVPRGVPIDDEFPPAPTRPNMRCVDSIWTQAVPIDDPIKALYKRQISGVEYFYERNYPQEGTMLDEKCLYVFEEEIEGLPNNVINMDKFGQEWSLVRHSEVRKMTFQGWPIFPKGIRETSESNYVPPVTGARPIPSAPPIPAGAAKVSFAEEYVVPDTTRGHGRETPFESTPHSGHRPSRTTHMHTMGGHSVGTGPTKPPTKSASIMGSTGFKPGKMFGETARSKTRPSHFQKWVKKYNGSADLMTI